MNHDVSDRHRSGHTEETFSFLLVSGKRTVVIFIDNGFGSNCGWFFSVSIRSGRSDVSPASAVKFIPDPLGGHDSDRFSADAFRRQLVKRAFVFLSALLQRTPFLGLGTTFAGFRSGTSRSGSPFSVVAKTSIARFEYVYQRVRVLQRNFVPCAVRTDATRRARRFARRRPETFGRRRRGRPPNAPPLSWARAAASRSEAERTQLARWFVRGAAGVCGFVVCVTVAAVHPSSRGRVAAVHPSSRGRVTRGTPVVGLWCPVDRVLFRCARPGVLVAGTRAPSDRRSHARIGGGMTGRLHATFRTRVRTTGAQVKGASDGGAGIRGRLATGMRSGTSELKFIFVISNYFVCRLLSCQIGFQSFLTTENSIKHLFWTVSSWIT